MANCLNEHIAKAMTANVLQHIGTHQQEFACISSQPYRLL